MPCVDPSPKPGLRRRLRAQRRDRVAGRDRAADDRALAALVPDLLARFGLSAGSVVLSYDALPHEPPTAALGAALDAAGVRVLLPVTEPDLDLDWHPLGRPDDLLGRDAPAGADLVLAPGLAVDRAGTRLGQGGGSYDRALARLRPGTPVLVVLHPGELVEDAPLPREPHDVSVDGVLTTDGPTTWEPPDRR